MTKGERADLGALVRRREKLHKTAAKQRSKELIADFEKQLDHHFSYDDDEIWKVAYASAEEATKKAQAIVAQQCRELGIPVEFAPSIQMGWAGQGENASKERRAELRRLAKTQIDALEAGAITEIERASVNQQTALIADGLTTEAANTFLEQMPTPETLMPVLAVDDVKALLPSDKRLR